MFQIRYGSSPDSMTRIGDERSGRRIAGAVTGTAVLVLASCGGGGGGGSPGSAGTGGTQVPSGPAITSQADSILHMDQLRAAGYRGAGVRVGVISTGVVNLASYQNAQLLPASLYVSRNTPGTLDEGDWMMELVHQHAPDAVLGFCDGWRQLTPDQGDFRN